MNTDQFDLDLEKSSRTAIERGAMRVLAWLLFVTGVSACVYVDAWRRRARLAGLCWAIGALFMSLIVVPLWYAKRPLKVQEIRSGGFAANASHGFSIIWAAAVSFNAAMIFLLDGRFVFAIAFWLAAMFVSSIVIVTVGSILKKDIVEHGPASEDA